MDGDCSHEIKRHLLLGRKARTNLDSIIKNQKHYFADKSPYSQSYGFCLVMYRCESQLIKKAESEELMLLKKTLESSLDSKEIKLVNPKGNEL